MTDSCTVTCSEVVEEEYLTKRVLKVKAEGRTDLEVTHYHFTGWQDWELPHCDSLTCFSELVASAVEFVKRVHHEQISHKLMVHCKAGIGRTGTLLALINCAISQTKDPFPVVSELRKQRPYMV